MIVLPIHPCKMHKLVRFWIRRINPQFATLLTAIAKQVPLRVIGTIGLFTCLAILLGLSWLFQEVLEKEAFGIDTTVLLGVHRWEKPSPRYSGTTPM